MSFEESELFKAITEFNSDTPRRVQQIIEEDETCDVNLKGSYNEGYLHVLSGPKSDDAVNAVISVIYMLSNAGIEVNGKDIEGHTALHVACLNDAHPRIVNTLIKAGGDPCLINTHDQDSLDLAEDTKVRRTLELLDPGLWRAVTDREIDKVTFLLDCWCKINFKQDGKKLLKHAEEVGDHKVINLLKKRKQEIALVHACLAGDEETAKDLSKKIVNLDIIDPSYVRETGKMTSMPLIGETAMVGQYACAKMLIKKGASVNYVIETEDGSSEPLYFYLLMHCENPPADFIKQLCKHADTSVLLAHSDPLELLYDSWKGGFPADFTNKLINSPQMLAWRNVAGLTVRDKIFVDSMALSKEEIRKNLYFIDQHVIAMATDGKTSELRQLVLDGYDHIMTNDLKGRSIKYLAKKHEEKETAKFLKGLPELQKQFRALHAAIIKGNLVEAKSLMNPESIQSRDRNGRTPLHIAVLHERKFIVSYITKEFPKAIKYTDFRKRTALHYACAIQEGQDIQEVLLLGGSDINAPDVVGNVPHQYGEVEYAGFIEQERDRQNGMKVYTMETYMELVDAIEAGSLDRVRDIKECMYEDISLDDFHSTSKMDTPLRPLLFQCVDNKRQEIAMYLIRHGADYRCTGKITKHNDEKETLFIEEAATYFQLHELVQCIQRKRARDEDEMQANAAFQSAVSSRNSSRTSSCSSRTSSNTTTSYTLSRTDPDIETIAEEPEQNGYINNNNNTNKTDKNSQKSSACTIL